MMSASVVYLKGTVTYKENDVRPTQTIGTTRERSYNNDLHAGGLVEPGQQVLDHWVSEVVD